MVSLAALVAVFVPCGTKFLFPRMRFIAKFALNDGMAYGSRALSLRWAFAFID